MQPPLVHAHSMESMQKESNKCCIFIFIQPKIKCRLFFPLVERQLIFYTMRFVRSLVHSLPIVEFGICVGRKLPVRTGITSRMHSIIFTFILRSFGFSGNGKLQQQQLIKFPMRSLAPNKSTHSTAEFSNEKKTNTKTKRLLFRIHS